MKCERSVVRTMTEGRMGQKMRRQSKNTSGRECIRTEAGQGKNTSGRECIRTEAGQGKIMSGRGPGAFDEVVDEGVMDDLGGCREAQLRKDAHTIGVHGWDT